MILVDASILIAFLRTASPAILSIFESQECGICGVTRAEILHGAKTANDSLRLTTALDRFIQLPTPEETWDRLGHHLAMLRSFGVTVPFQDILLATIAIDRDAQLWSYDQHFRLMQNCLPALRLFPGPAI